MLHSLSCCCFTFQGYCQNAADAIALLNPETSILLQRRPSYSGNLDSETPGDSKTRFNMWRCFRYLLDCDGVVPVGVEGSRPYQCSMCGVCTSSQPLLEAHFKGRRHLKRALEQAHADAADLGLQPTPAPASAIPR